MGESAERAAWYRERAEQIRVEAAGLKSSLKRRGMIELAEDYEQMARRLEPEPHTALRARP